jgi:hypothetical protein
VQPSVFSLDDLQLLAKAEINPDDLDDPIQLMSIKNGIKNKGILNADDLAVLKLLSHADSDNDLDIVDQKEQEALSKSIQEGEIRSPNTQHTS